MELSLTEAIGLFYILLGISICSIAHVSSYASTYEARLPVIFRLTTLRRWIKEKIEQVKL